MALYKQSDLDFFLQDHYDIDGEQFYFYVESAFILRPYLQISFNRNTGTVTVLQQLFNAAISSDPEIFRWSYKDVKQ